MFTQIEREVEAWAEKVKAVPREEDLNDPRLFEFIEGLFTDHPLNNFNLRRFYCHRRAWAITSPQVVQLIASRFPRIVEMGAGSGWWAKHLSEAGSKIVAFDNRSSHRFSRSHYPVFYGGPKRLKMFPNHSLFLCWPPMTNMATRCLQYYYGDTVIYIGEGEGGCTANDTFFRTLEGWDMEWIRIPHWGGLHDHLRIYQR
jgi:hypothetical protein